MRQALFKCGTPRLELKSLQSLLAIKRFQRTKIKKVINSSTPKCVPAGTKISLSEDFWLAKHKHTNIPTMMEPFSSPAAWF